MDYTSAARQLYQAMQQAYAVPGTDLYREDNPPQPSDRMDSYLWPFTQAFGGVAASYGALSGAIDAKTALADLANGLAAYWNPLSVPPGYDSYVVSQGGGTQFFDDNGRNTQRSYADTQCQVSDTRAAAVSVSHKWLE